MLIVGSGFGNRVISMILPFSVLLGACLVVVKTSPPACRRQVNPSPQGEGLNIIQVWTISLTLSRGEGLGVRLKMPSEAGEVN